MSELNHSAAISNVAKRRRAIATACLCAIGLVLSFYAALRVSNTAAHHVQYSAWLAFCDEAVATAKRADVIRVMQLIGAKSAREQLKSDRARAWAYFHGF